MLPRLPTDDEWRQMATHYGGLGNDSPEKGKAAYTAIRTAPFYNFGKGSQALYRQPQGQKQMAVSVRCVRE